jgi:hypothetical protein
MSPSQQSQWLGLVQTASAQVKKARTLDADWAPGTLEAADFALDATLAGQAPPTPEPAPPQIAAVIGTYSGHGLAKDAYAGLTPEQVSWGPHHGLPIVAPADGRVELYTFGTPLSLVHSTGRVCGPASGALRRLDVQAPTVVRAARRLAGRQRRRSSAPRRCTWPCSGRRRRFTIEGQRVGHLHYGHVRGDVRTGAIARGEQFATSWDRASVSSRRAARARRAYPLLRGGGDYAQPQWRPAGTARRRRAGLDRHRHRHDAGPQDYQGGRYTAGRLTSDFTSAGRPIPPMPGQ